jgi:methyltransferase FkbM-like protein
MLFMQSVATLCTSQPTIHYRPFREHTGFTTAYFERLRLRILMAGSSISAPISVIRLRRSRMGRPKSSSASSPRQSSFRNLSKNAAIIAAGGATLRLAQVAIGFGQGDITLAEGAGTARRASAGSRVQCIPLDRLVAAHCGSDVIGFIKCDVDGYDAEALFSGTRIIELDHPILLFECDLPDRNEMACYARLWDSYWTLITK